MNEVDQLFDHWAGAVRRGDAEALAELVTEDCEFWTHGAPALQGRDMVGDIFRKAFARGSYDQTWNEIERLSGDDFCVSIGIEISQVVPEGGEPVVITQRGWTMARRCGDGRWRFARGTTNRES